MQTRRPQPAAAFGSTPHLGHINREKPAMKAAYIEQPGPPERIVFGNLPKPKPADGQVLGYAFIFDKCTAQHHYYTPYCC